MGTSPTPPPYDIEVTCSRPPFWRHPIGWARWVRLRGWRIRSIKWTVPACELFSEGPLDGPGYYHFTR